GWPEGIGYWNYGMRYAFLYLLAHEGATRTKHPLLERPETRATLRFPLQFTPNGVPASFGDVNHWRPFSFHYAAATRYGDTDVIAALDAALSRPRHPGMPGDDDPVFARRRSSPFSGEGRPDAAELLLYHPGEVVDSPQPETNVARLFRGMDWAILADRLPDPTLYLSIRGGTTDVSHSHLDLLSFHCVIGDEQPSTGAAGAQGVRGSLGESLITNLGVSEYLDTTFGPRRFELFETTPASKNTILVNGVGITQHSRVTTEPVEFAGHKGFRLDASAAMGTMRDGPATTFCGRLFLLLADLPAVLIVDRIELPYPGRAEIRFHTLTRTSLTTSESPSTEGDPTVAHLQGARHGATLAFASTVPALLRTAQPALTTPSSAAQQPTALRWCTQSRSHTSITFATLILPEIAAPSSAALTLQEENGTLTLASPFLRGGSLIHLTTRLDRAH
ncbi:MAG TPA: hypothetical protein VFN74_10885, partial [Chloroflexota bacterium]|nr:hypothetical protein [Chloroflexota bacterium]